jgi:CRISPR-associated protein Csb1
MSAQAANHPAQDLLGTLFAEDRVLITASLKLTNGRFLQPTGFPDIGACVYRDKEGRRWCLVESEQSMANRLEAVCMKPPGVWVDELKGLPVIAVYDGNGNGNLLTTNLTEPHRIASSYVLEGKVNGNQVLRNIAEKLGLLNAGDFWPLDKRAELEKLVFALDPAALLHGFQFVQWKFVGLRQTRLLHGRLEAELADEPEVHYGMVKWDAIEPESTREERANKGQSIAAKSRIVPREITAWFEIDMLGLRNLTLADDQKKFLLGLALWKIGAFLANRPAFDPRSRQGLPSLRLRADCYLRCKEVRWKTDSRSDGTTPEDLMRALPAVPGFETLVNEAFAVEGRATTGASTEASAEGTKVYEGPLMKVTYGLKGKEAISSGAPPASESQESETEDEKE